MPFDAPKEGGEQLKSIPELRKAVNELKKISGLSTLQNDPRTKGPEGRPGEHPLTKFFRLDPLAPSTDPSRPQQRPDPLKREDLRALRSKVVEDANSPQATWDQQMTAVILEYYATRSALPEDLRNHDAIEAGANIHMTRLMTNVYGATEFISTFDLYVKFLEENPSSRVHRDAKVEANLLQDAQKLTALMPYWGRVIQVHFLTIQKRDREAGVARAQMQAARDAIPKDVAAGIPANVKDLPVPKLLETVSPIEKSLRDIVFAQSEKIESPRHDPSVIEKLVKQVTGKEDQDALRASLAQIGMTEGKTQDIRSRRVTAAYINLLVLHRRSEADKIIKDAADGKVPPEDIAKLFKGHKDVSQRILQEHRFGLQTTTTHMFAGTLGLSTTLKQDPSNSLNKFDPKETNALANFLEILKKTPTNPIMQEDLRIQRQESAKATRKYIVYMREEALTLRVSTQLIDGVYVQPAIQELSEGIKKLSEFLEGKVAGVANWFIWGPVLAYYFPSLRDRPFPTTPEDRQKLINDLQQMKGEAEEELKKVQSLHKTIDETRKALADAQKEIEPHLQFIEKMSDADLDDPKKVKEAQEHLEAIAKIDERIATIITTAWENIETNMQVHAKTTANFAQSENSMERMAWYVAGAFGSVILHLGYNMYMAGRATTTLGRYASFFVRSGLSATAGPFYPATEILYKTGKGLTGLVGKKVAVKGVNITPAHRAAVLRLKDVRASANAQTALRDLNAHAGTAIENAGQDVQKLLSPRELAEYNQMRCSAAEKVLSEGQARPRILAPNERAALLKTHFAKMSPAEKVKALIQGGFSEEEALLLCSREVHLAGTAAEAAELAPKAVGRVPGALKGISNYYARSWTQATKLQWAGYAAANIGYGLSVGFDVIALMDAKEHEQKVRMELDGKLRKAGFEAKGDWKYTHPKMGGYEIELKSLSTMSDDAMKHLIIDGAALTASVIAGPCIATGPAGAVVFGVVMAAHGVVNAIHREDVLSVFEQLDPYLLTLMPPIQLVGESGTDLLRATFSDLVSLRTDKAPEIKNKVLFSIFFRELSTKHQDQFLEIFGSGTPTVEQIEEFYKGDFKTFILPYLKTRLFMLEKESGRIKGGAEIKWKDIRDVNAQFGAMEVFRSEWVIQEQIGATVDFYINHLRELHYLTLRQEITERIRKGEKVGPDEQLMYDLAGDISVYGTRLSEIANELDKNQEKGEPQTRAQKMLEAMFAEGGAFHSSRENKDRSDMVKENKDVFAIPKGVSGFPYDAPIFSKEAGKYANVLLLAHTDPRNTGHSLLSMLNGIRLENDEAPLEHGKYTEEQLAKMFTEFAVKTAQSAPLPEFHLAGRISFTKNPAVPILSAIPGRRYILREADVDPARPVFSSYSRFTERETGGPVLSPNPDYQNPNAPKYNIVGATDPRAPELSLEEQQRLQKESFVIESSPSFPLERGMRAQFLQEMIAPGGLRVTLKSTIFTDGRVRHEAYAPGVRTKNGTVTVHDSFFITLTKDEYTDYERKLVDQIEAVRVQAQEQEEQADNERRRAKYLGKAVQETRTSTDAGKEKRTYDAGVTLLPNADPLKDRFATLERPRNTNVRDVQAEKDKSPYAIVIRLHKSGKESGSYTYHQLANLSFYNEDVFKDVREDLLHVLTVPSKVLRLNSRTNKQQETLDLDESLRRLLVLCPEKSSVYMSSPRDFLISQIRLNETDDQFVTAFLTKFFFILLEKKELTPDNVEEVLKQADATRDALAERYRIGKIVIPNHPLYLANTTQEITFHFTSEGRWAWRGTWEPLTVSHATTEQLDLKSVPGSPLYDRYGAQQANVTFAQLEAVNQKKTVPSDYEVLKGNLPDHDPKNAFEDARPVSQHLDRLNDSDAETKGNFYDAIYGKDTPVRLIDRGDDAVPVIIYAKLSGEKKTSVFSVAGPVDTPEKIAEYDSAHAGRGQEIAVMLRDILTAPQSQYGKGQAIARIVRLFPVIGAGQNWEKSAEYAFVRTRLEDYYFRSGNQRGLLTALYEYCRANGGLNIAKPESFLAQMSVYADMKNDSQIKESVRPAGSKLAMDTLLGTPRRDEISGQRAEK